VRARLGTDARSGRPLRPRSSLLATGKSALSTLDEVLQGDRGFLNRNSAYTCGQAQSRDGGMPASVG
jgi:hypothetical protein